MSVRLPIGYRAAGVYSGVKRNTSKLDLSLVVSDRPAVAAGVYTKNLVCAAPVKFDRERTPGESIRVFPLSNWTELDIWRYIGAEDLELPSIYFAHEREVFERDGMLYATSEWLQPEDGERAFTERVRYRTVGDMTITGAVRSDAADVEAVIAETAATRLTERGATRADDRTSEAAMEDRKREGYF